MRIASKAFVLDFVQAVFSIRHFMTNRSSPTAVCVRFSLFPLDWAARSQLGTRSFCDTRPRP